MEEVRFQLCLFFFFQAEDGIRDAQESRGLGDVYKRQDNEYLIGTLLRKIAELTKKTDVETAVNTIAKQYKFDNLRNFKKGLIDLANTEFYSDYFTNYKE